ACERLHHAVNAGALAQQVRLPYHPHVTIAHDLDDDRLDTASASRADFKARFPVARFVLYEYGEDGIWRDVEVFRLVADRGGGSRQWPRARTPTATTARTAPHHRAGWHGCWRGGSRPGSPARSGGTAPPTGRC